MVPIIFTVLEKVQPCSRKINSAHKIKGARPCQKKALRHFQGQQQYGHYQQSPA
jgi:hypothetical protein